MAREPSAAERSGVGKCPNAIRRPNTPSNSEGHSSWWETQGGPDPLAQGPFWGKALHPLQGELVGRGTDLGLQATVLLTGSGHQEPELN